MYIKLTLKNVKRSIKDYLLYMTTFIISISIITISNLLSLTAQIQNNLQSQSLPLLISLILVILLNYISNFMLKQRAKEFAAYILLGIGQNKIALLFFCESLILGFICFVLGLFLGNIIFSITYLFISIKKIIITQSFLNTLIYFGIIELINLGLNYYHIKEMKIKKLMYENRQNENYKGIKQAIIWSILFFISFFIYMGLLYLIAIGEMGKLLIFSISIISISLLISIFTFYKSIFCILAEFRKRKHKFLYSNNKLYIISQFLSKLNSNSILNAVLSICLLFSALSFIVGIVMILLPNTVSRIFMGFCQICICIILIVIYFSILSVKQIVEIKKERYSFKIMLYLGKTNIQIKKIVLNQILLKFLLPTGICIIFILTLIFTARYKLNVLADIITISAGGFILCFVLLYIIYLFITYKSVIQYLKSYTKSTI